MKKWIICIAAAAVLICAAAVIFFLRPAPDEQEKAEAVVNSFITELENNRFDDALTYVEPAEAQLIEAAMQQTSLDELPLMLKLILNSTSDQLNVTHNISSEKTVVDNDSADVTAEISYTLMGEHSAVLNFRLMKISSDWYIQYITLG